MTAANAPDLFARLAAPRVLTVPHGVAFLPTLASALLDGRLIPGFRADLDPLGLSQATVFLPTRRAARTFARLLVERSPAGALFLPRIVPLGDVDEDTLALAEGGAFDLADPLLRPAIPPTERRLILTRLVLEWARSVDRGLLRLSPGEALLVPSSPADALALAADLERLMDKLTMQSLDWHALAAAVEARHSDYFKITLAFLRIVGEVWPAILDERGASDPIARRDALLDAEAARLLGRRGAPPPLAPMIAAGSTGSVPATARLIAAIARLANGAVVLPGLDQDLDEASFALLADDDAGHAAVPPFSHPQTIMARLLKAIGVGRRDVATLGAPPAEARDRARLLSEALRPAATTDLWAQAATRLSPAAATSALAGVAIVEAADERAEALAAAIAIRETLERPGATVALVTPDRGLAVRVCAELQRWGIVADDSAGRPLAQTSAGRFARLVAAAAAADCAPRTLIALVTHPAARFGLSAVDAGRAAAALEIGLLRGAAPPAGIAGLRAVFDERRAEARTRFAARPLQRLTDTDWALAHLLIDRIEGALAGLMAEGLSDLLDIAAAHREAIGRAAASSEADDAKSEADVEALLALFGDLASADCRVPGRLVDYPDFFAGLAAERVLRDDAAAGPREAHGRVQILGLLEARLIDVDRIVLGGLDETLWPPATRTDAFLNRPMAAALGLAAPEQRIGQTAHDFVSALGVRDAVITRAAKRGGAPTVPSRFLQRLRAVAQTVDDGAAWSAALARGRHYLSWMRALDAGGPVKPLGRPAPRPPLETIPRSLSVTEVETLVRDPYAIFARHVLGLDPLDDLAVPPGASDRGTIIHDVLGAFAQAYPGALPEDPVAELLALGREAFLAIAAYPDVVAQWWPRFEQTAMAFARWEGERRPAIDDLYAEVSGRLDLTAGGQPFQLRARADRIERLRDGSFAVLDFKTGQPPTSREVFAGFAPQLTLEAAMLMQGAFAGVPASPDPAALVYVHMRGSSADPLRERPLKPPPGDQRTVAELVEQHFARFRTLMGRYLTGEAGFVARPFPKYAKRYNDYDHLARVREWGLLTTDEDEPWTT